jgi:hypothetical protein
MLRRDEVKVHGERERDGYVMERVKKSRESV